MSEVTQTAPSVVATQKLAVAQDTLPSSFDVSDVTVDQDVPPLAVPASATVVPELAAQQRWRLAQEMEFSQPVLSKICSPLQVAPPFVELISTGPAAAGAAPAASHTTGLVADGPARQETLKRS